MDEGAVIFTLFVGGMIGTLCTLMIQYYGRRKVKKALLQEGLAPSRQTELLANENGALKGQVSRLEERISVMERITTDNHLNVAREIENLR